jgi:predicted CoA-binding protein
MVSISLKKSKMGQIRREEVGVERYLDVFLNPRSVAVIGASEKPGSWGSFIMEGLLSRKYPGKIYPVNRRSTAVYALPAYPEIKSVPGAVDLAVFTIPEDSVEELIRACGVKGVKGSCDHWGCPCEPPPGIPWTSGRQGLLIFP